MLLRPQRLQNNKKKVMSKKNNIIAIFPCVAAAVAQLFFIFIIKYDVVEQSAICAVIKILQAVFSK